MKTIYLKKLLLSNFKGIKSLEIDFRSHETHISGANGSGKTTVFDAFTWLLFGKDSHDRKDFNIKTLDATGEPKRKLEHVVVGQLSVNGQDITLKRVFKEKWVKKNGSLEHEFAGNTTDYYIDDVPKQLKEYTSEVAEILDESIFKLITNPKYFSSLGWKEQREILFTIAGTISDAEIAAGNKEFSELLSRLNGKKLSDYKKQISETKKLLKNDLEQIPTRIDEADKSRPEDTDFTELENELNNVKKELTQIESSIENKSNAYQQAFEKNQAVLNKINEKKQQQSEIVFKKTSELMEEDRKIKSEKIQLQNEVKDLQRTITQYTETISRNNRTLEANQISLNELREEWYRIDKEVYTPENNGKLLCPVWNIACGDPESLRLNAENENKAHEVFNSRKIKKQESINEQGISFNKQIDSLRAENEELTAKIEDARIQIDDLEKKIILYPADHAVINKPSPTAIPEWNTLQREIETLSAQVTEPEAVNNDSLKESRANCHARIQEINKLLGQKDMNARIDQRIEELEKKGQSLAQQISDLEKDEYVIEQFSKARIEESESRINGRFNYVKFKLFEVQINGSEVETCQMTISGVPYSDANTASQINAGLDVIKVLTEFHGVTAPIFIDNRESVTDLIDMNSQIINLKVSSDKKLKIQ